ncbi:MAG: ABC transporter permease [Propionibacteriales bacterium]|nr:ABC transporter permease [Propionibacteriales bacterium]
MTTVDTESALPSTTSGARTYQPTSHPLWRRWLVSREAAVIALLIIVIVYSMNNIAFFDSKITMTFLLLDVAPILLIALPMTLVIITGEIDLSVASVVALSSVLVGVLIDHGWPIELASFAALLAGAVCGFVNGWLVTAVGLPSLAVTIGTLALYRGLAVGLLGTTAITDFPENWKKLAQGQLGTTGVPNITVPFVVLLVVFITVLHFTPFGRGVYAVGKNEAAARFSGIRVERTKLIVFVLSGVVSALAGLYYTLRFGSSRGDNATGMELQVIAAVLLGGVSIFGGRGALVGVVAGVLLIGVLGSALRLDNYTADVIQIITGLLLVASVVATSVLNWIGSLRRRPPASTPTSRGNHSNESAPSGSPR